MAGKKKQVLSTEKIMELLDVLYAKAVDGVPVVSPPIEKFAQDYLKHAKNSNDAAKKMINYQVLKCTTSGVVTGFGGVITLPVAIPANISSVLYVQMRMIACTAYMAGLDVHSDQVQTLIYACLAGVSLNGVAKKVGVRFGKKLAEKMIQKIPGGVLVKINQKVGFRFLTKFGEKGIINLGKGIPGVGAVINGGFDFVETKIIGNRAYKMFFEGDFSGDDKTEEVEIVDADYKELDGENSN